LFIIYNASPNVKRELSGYALFIINLSKSGTREYSPADKFEYKFWHPYNDSVLLGAGISKKDGKKASVIIVDVKTGF